MIRYQEVKTKKAKIEFIKEKLETDTLWLIKGLITIYDLQTEDEKQSNQTNVHNDVGFSAFDAELMTSLAKKAISKGARDLIAQKLRPDLRGMYSYKERNLLLKKMKKYARQLSRIAESKSNA